MARMARKADSSNEGARSDHAGRSTGARRAVVLGSHLVNWCGVAGMEIGGVAWIYEDFD